MHKGDIVLVPFPFSDLSGQKVRPALVLFVSRGNDCILAFITGTKEKRESTDIKVKMSKGNGLKLDSYIRVAKLATLEKKIILGQLGRLETNYWAQVNNVLKRMFK